MSYLPLLSALLPSIELQQTEIATNIHFSANKFCYINNYLYLCADFSINR